MQDIRWAGSTLGLEEENNRAGQLRDLWAHGSRELAAALTGSFHAHWTLIDPLQASDKVAWRL